MSATTSTDLTPFEIFASSKIVGKECGKFIHAYMDCKKNKVRFLLTSIYNKIETISGISYIIQYAYHFYYRY